MKTELRKLIQELAQIMALDSTLQLMEKSPVLKAKFRVGRALAEHLDASNRKFARELEKRYNRCPTGERHRLKCKWGLWASALRDKMQQKMAELRPEESVARGH